jgi:hypothetical protein
MATIKTVQNEFDVEVNGEAVVLTQTSAVQPYDNMFVLNAEGAYRLGARLVAKAAQAEANAGEIDAVPEPIDEEPTERIAKLGNLPACLYPTDMWPNAYCPGCLY